MPTEELKQALRSANVHGVDKDFVDLLCRLFDAPRPLVLRILYAAQYAAVESHVYARWMQPEELPAELREAISKRVKIGAGLIHLRRAVENGETVNVASAKLIPRDKPERVCRGCPQSLDCVAESISTPAACAAGNGPAPRRFEVKPVRIVSNKVTVECVWPEGRYALDAEDFDA